MWGQPTRLSGSQVYRAAGLFPPSLPAQEVGIDRAKADMLGFCNSHHYRGELQPYFGPSNRYPAPRTVFK